jgi:hypothetical protein
MKSKRSKKRRSKTRKRIDLRTILGILIILTGVVLTVVLFIDSRVRTGTESAAITSEINEEGSNINNALPNDDMDISHEYRTIEYRGLAFTVPMNWYALDTDDGLSIMITNGEQANILFIETMASNIELSLEDNLAQVTTIFSDSIPDLEREAIPISGLPALRHQYVVAVDDIYYDIIGFLFPNRNELVYVQFGTPAGETVNEETLESITHMITTLELPPSEFPPREQ